MAVDLKTYLWVTVVIGVVIALQIFMAQGSLGLLLVLSLLNAFIAALFSMGLKSEGGTAVGLIWLLPFVMTTVYVLGMVLA